MRTTPYNTLPSLQQLESTAIFKKLVSAHRYLTEFKGLEQFMYNRLTEDGFLQKQKVERDNYYINLALFNILTTEPVS